MNSNFAFLKSHFGVTEAVYKKFVKLATQRTVKANTIILKSGSMASNINFITHGIARSYLTTESGKEHNKTIYTESGFMAPFTALVRNRPSELSYESLTECTFYEFSYKDLKKLSKENIQIANAYNSVLEQVFVTYEQRELQLMALDATERYRLLQKSITNIDDLIPQYQIASYLNITPVQLSRIRKKL